METRPLIGDFIIYIMDKIMSSRWKSGGAGGGWHARAISRQITGEGGSAVARSQSRRLGHDPPS